MKKIYPVIAILIILALTIFFGLQRESPENALGENVKFFLFTRHSTPTGKAMASIPLAKTMSGAEMIDVGIDFNNDGGYFGSEWVIKGFPINVKEGRTSNLYFDYPGDIKPAQKAKIVLGTEEKEVDFSTVISDIGDLLDLESVTNPEEAMKGIGTVFAADGDVDISLEGDVPDITQAPGECGPTAAANSLVHLIQKHGDDEDLPEDLNDFLEELKDSMNWTRENGALPDDFVTGKNNWAVSNGLPITTEKVGDGHGETTLEEIENALSEGKAVEMRMKFGDPATGQAVGGHMVTVTGMRRSGGRTYLDIHDPASPPGTDTVEINGNQITNYGLFEGWTLVSWGFVQTWEAPAVSTGGEGEEGTTPKTPDDGKEEPEEESEEPEEEEPEEKPKETPATPPSVSMDYEHVKPGQYSEIYVDIEGHPYVLVILSLTGPGVMSNNSQSGQTDGEGYLNLTWQINAYGPYSVGGTVGDQSISSNITVQ